MDKISKILPKVVANRNLSSKSKASLVCEKMRQFINDQFGEVYLLEINNIIFKNSNIYISTNNSSFNHSLFLMHENILAFLNQELPNILIKKIYF